MSDAKNQVGDGPVSEDVDVEAGKNVTQDAAEERLKDSDIIAALNSKLGNFMNNSLYNLPKPVKRSIKALKKIQLTHVNLEVDFFKELHILEMKYEKMFEPLYEKRRLIVTGTVVPTDEECDYPSDSEKEEDLSNEIQKVKVEDDTEGKDTVADVDIKGIPEFWLTAFKNAPTIADMIEEYDEPILKHLSDVKAMSSLEPMSFTIEFYFEPNEYFTNTVLTKVYELKCSPDPTDVFSFEGPEIVKCKGCTIEWKKGKNVTVKTIKKKQKHKARGAVRTVTKTVQNDSFFNFFSPPAAQDEQDVDDETSNTLSNDFEVGNLIKDRVIPNAVLFFTGENLVDDEFDEEEDDEDEEDYDEDEDEEDDDEEENDNQCLNRKKSKGQNQTNPSQAPPECKQQ